MNPQPLTTNMPQYRYCIRRAFHFTYASLYKDTFVSAYLKKRSYPLRLRFQVSAGSFQDCSVLEFDPAEGENVFVCAILGAVVSLLKLVLTFHDPIRNDVAWYYQQDGLRILHADTLQPFRSHQQFDLVEAKGFVNTTWGAKDWTRQLFRWLAPEVMLLLSVCALGGFLIELLQSRVYRLVSTHLHRDEVEQSAMILEQKWQTLKHSRSFASSAKDLLFHPSCSVNILDHRGPIVSRMTEQGMVLYSAWPTLNPSRDVTLIREVTSAPERVWPPRQAAVQMLPNLLLARTVAIDEAVPSDGYTCLLQSLWEDLRAMGAWTYPYMETDLSRIMEMHQSGEQQLGQVVADYKNYCLAQWMREISLSMLAMITAPQDVTHCFDPRRVLSSVLEVPISIWCLTGRKPDWF